jgi:hypothetical protein
MNGQAEEERLKYGGEGQPDAGSPRRNEKTNDFQIHDIKTFEE